MMATAVEPAAYVGMNKKIIVGKAVVSVDDAEFEFYVDMKPGAGPTDWRHALATASALGLTVLPEWECEADLLSDGTLRHHMTPTVADER